MLPGHHFIRILGTLRQRSFGAYIAGNSVSLIGTWMQRVAAGWLVWELTGSAAWVGVLAFLDLFPALVIAPFAGVLSDRWDRTRIMKFGQLCGAAIAILLAALHFGGAGTLGVVLIATFLLGVVDAFLQPFRLALVPSLVARTDLTAAVAIKSVTFNMARFIGPAIAGVVIAGAGVGWAFLANGLSFMALFVAMCFVVARPEPRVSGGPGVTVISQALEGVRYTLSAPGIGPVLFLLLATCVAGRPLIEMLPAWAGAEFGGTATDLAMLTSAVGIGAMLGGIWLAGRPGTQGLLRVFFVCCAGIVATQLAFALAPGMPVALPVMALVGFFLVSAAICAQTLVQLNVDGHMRGRVMSVYALILKGGPAFGALFMGFAAELWGLRLSLMLVMIVLALAILLLAQRHHKLARILEPMN